MLKIIHKDSVLGEAFGIFTDELLAGLSHILFAGKVWTVSVSVDDEAVRVIPAPPGTGSIALNNIGVGPRFDAFLTDKMWHMIHER